MMNSVPDILAALDQVVFMAGHPGWQILACAPDAREHWLTDEYLTSGPTEGVFWRGCPCVVDEKLPPFVVEMRAEDGSPLASVRVLPA